ncbi:hypothetical protein FHEFKHOI_01343 [Candidatus Methanoperedenaceae archaeon GB50]|nr:hypothetical protein FHEFKHOI_01343 [Candidatus Methanoperedenaceae archaeon GB50]
MDTNIKKRLQIATTAILVMAVFTVMLTPAMADSSDTCKDAIRVYGFLDKGAGNRSVECENPPYTDAIAPFWPQAKQAPEKDFLTFNPIVMEHDDYDWDNDGVNDFVYRNSIKVNAVDANEKEFFRMWYEPVEWIKDEDCDTKFDVVLTNGDVTTIDEYEGNLLDYLKSGIGIEPSNEDTSKADLYAPTIKQEFTFMFLDTNNDPISAPTGNSHFLVPMASWVDDNGIDSFDADGDEKPDPVRVCSEADLGDVNSDGIPEFLDIDGDGVLETLSDDGLQLTGDETLVLRLDPKTVHEGERLQFFDFEIELEDTTESGRALINIYYRGNPNSYGDELIGQVNLGADLIPTPGSSFATFARGGVNTFLSPRGPGFVWVTDVDWEDDTARIIIGRMFGNTHANIGCTPDPWAYQKHFYVDGVLYNVVAIKTVGQDELKYVTFRAKLVKVPLWIENHSTQLVGWAKNTTLPVMPQFNMLHAMMLDVADTWDDTKKGPIVEPDTPLEIVYINETEEPRFHGELREILGEPCEETTDTTDDCYPWLYEYEGWWIDWFQTIPYQYTEFVLPYEHGPYLMTSAFYADEAVYNYMDDGVSMDDGRGARLKFWYDTCQGPLFIDRETDSVRIYGFLDKGAGDRSVNCENPPYTDAIAPFWPQAKQAPAKDFITFNPIKMKHNDYDWDNDGVNDYVYRNSIKANNRDADEKEFFRMWYEPVEWIKDEDCDGKFDVVLTNNRVITIDKYEKNLLKYLKRGVGIKPSNEDTSKADLYAPTIKQEFTFMFLDTNNDPISAPTGSSKFLVPMASWVDDNGIDSFDADGDEKPDPVRVCSEADLGDVNSDGIPEFLDIDGDGVLETLSDDGLQLSGDEILVLRLDPKTVHEGERLQFFDFEIELEDTTESGRALINIYYRGNPNSYGDELIGQVNLGADLIPTPGSSFATFARGGVNTFLSPRGPGFVWVTDVDWEDDTARIIIGRMFGNTHANIGCTPDPWAYQKHFYVDGVLYNVVAIKTVGQDELKYVTFRAKLVKVPFFVENHSTQLVGWEENTTLPVMPQFNMNHAILNDVWPAWDHVKKGEPPMDAPALDIVYTAETKEPRFHGELREILGEPGYYPWDGTMATKAGGSTGSRRYHTSTQHSNCQKDTDCTS